MRRALACVLLLSSPALADRRALVRAVDSTVSVQPTDGWGSGLAVGRSKAGGAWILTSAHLFDEKDKVGAEAIVTATAADGQTQEQPAFLTKIDRQLDLALLLAPTVSLRPSKIGRIPAFLSRVYVVGAPNWTPRVVSEGFFSGVVEDEPATWQITGAFVYAGSSGGPVFNERGELVCIVRQYSARKVSVVLLGANVGEIERELPQIGYCIPSDKIRLFLKGAM